MGTFINILRFVLDGATQTKRRDDKYNLDQEIGKALAIEEYKAIRELIKMNINIMERSETYVAGAVGAIALFAFSAKQYDVTFASSALPTWLTILGYSRYRALNKIIDIHNDYLEQIEIRHKETLVD